MDWLQVCVDRDSEKAAFTAVHGTLVLEPHGRHFFLRRVWSRALKGPFRPGRIRFRTRFWSEPLVLLTLCNSARPCVDLPIWPPLQCVPYKEG